MYFLFFLVFFLSVMFIRVLCYI